MPAARADGAALPSPAKSVASKAVSASYRPDTPGSEMVSDSASALSASVSASRAGSPPLSRVGSAVIQSTTKSQQRKQRKEALKQESKTVTEALKPEPKEHAPVIGRKKKQKKEKPAKAAAAQAHEESAKDGKAASESVTQEDGKGKEPEDADARANSQKPGKGKGKEKEDKDNLAVAQPQPTPPPAEPSAPAPQPAEPEKPQAGPASVFAEIRSTLWTTADDKLQMFKPVSSSSSRQEHGNGGNGGGGPVAASKTELCKDCACKCGKIHDEDLAALRAGKAVRKQFHVDGSRMLITPNGDCVRGLTPDEEDAFLGLQAAIAATAENPGTFVAPRHQPGTGAFSLIKGRAVLNGRPNIFPATAQPQPQDPIGKLQREDALSYINQYVLPRLNLGTTSNMGPPPKGPPPRDPAAASLHSLAPYFYGPDAAAGVGIYNAPDGARGVPDYASSQSEDMARIPSTVGALGALSLMSVEDAETALAAARKETDKLEKGLNAVIRRNRRLLLGGAS